MLLEDAFNTFFFLRAMSLNSGSHFRPDTLDRHQSIPGGLKMSVLVPVITVFTLSVMALFYSGPLSSPVKLCNHPGDQVRVTGVTQTASLDETLKKYRLSGQGGTAPLH